MNSSSSGTRSSETPTAQWGPSFPVHIYIYHSPRIAKVFFPESYSNLDDSLFKPPNAEELKRWLRGVQSHVHMTWLSENLPGCYTLQLSDPRNDTLKDLLQRLEGECGLPQSIASHFTLFDNGTKLREPRPVQFQATVLQALAMALTDKDDMTSLEERERSCLRLIMVTTAAAAGHLTGCWFLDKNVPNPTSRRRRSLPPAIVGRWKWWLHTWYAVKYLRSALTRGQEDLEMLRTKLKDYERQERFQSHWLAISFWNWRKLVEGSEECSTQIEPEDLDERRSFIDEEYRRLRKITIKFCEEYMSDAPRPAHSVPIEDHPGSGASSKTGDALEEEELASDNTLGKQRSEPGFRQREADRSYKWFGPEPAPSLASTYTIPTRNRDGRLNSDSTFTVRTGILLWGHIMQVYSGSLDTEFTGNATSVPPEYRAGTIKRQKFTYRSAARNGTWKLRRAYTNFDPTTGGSDDGDPPVRQFGWIMHHEDIDAEETITRCSVIGAYGQIGNAFANGNTHADKDILYINRYDWGGSYYWGKPDDPTFKERFASFIRGSNATLDSRGETDPESETRFPELEGMERGSSYHLLAMDASCFSHEAVVALHRALKLSDPEGPTERIFVKTNQAGEAERLGAYGFLGHGIWDPWDFAWLVFSGRKHEQHTSADELVAIVWDNMYEGLAGDEHAVEEDPSDV